MNPSIGRSMTARRQYRAVGGFKSMRNGAAYCGCCIAIGAAGTALVPMASASQQEREVEIGLYLPGTIHLMMEQTPVQLELRTEYPCDGQIDIGLSLPQGMSETFTLSLRIPSFAENSRAWVQGKEIPNVQAGQFLHVARRWQDGDTVRLLLDLHPRIVYGQENPPTHGAVLYGALVLARDKRVSEVGTPVTLGEQVEVTRIPNPPIPCQGMFEVVSGRERLLMVDYASAGQTWRRDSEMEAWMRLKKD